MALFKNSFNYQELIDCAKGKLAGVDFPKLPLPPMLMFDEVTNIKETGGAYNKGTAHAQFKITPDKWFFPCHFENDPVMPGCLGMDALWQLLGFSLGNMGGRGKGRAISVGEVKFTGQILPIAKKVDVKIPLNALTVVSGVSGSGKTSLVKKILYPALLRHFDIYSDKPGAFSEIKGDLKKLNKVEFIDQNPIGRSSRSNPITYIKAYDDIRALFASQNISKKRKYLPKHFSFNVDGGRCDNCKGEGVITIEMQFMADVILECENCNGKRFKKEILQVKYQNTNIDDLLKMTVDDSIIFFKENNQNRIVQKLKPLKDVGLGYITLGQSSATLSGGEAQRIKLASFISHGNSKDNVLFIFDEPTTGLHFHDIKKLLDSFYALIENGHSIVVVEHNLELIKCADHIIDLGPEAGEKGGYLVGQGTPESIIKIKKSYTGKYLKSKLE